MQYVSMRLFYDHIPDFNHQETGNMQKKILSIIINVDTDRQSYKQDIRKTVSSLKDFLKGCDAAECILLYSSEKSAGKISKALKEESASVKMLPFEDLDKTEVGEYVMPVKQGDVFKSTEMQKAMSFVESTGRGVYAIPVTDVAKKKKIEDNLWESIHAEPLTELPIPHGTIIKTSLTGGPSRLLTEDIESIGAVVGALLTDGGFYRINSKDLLKPYYGESTDYSLKDSVVDELMAIADSKYGCKTDFLQNTLLTLLMLQSGEGAIERVERNVKLVDTGIITANELLNIPQKLWLLRLKYGKEVLKESEINDSGQIIFDGQPIMELKQIRFRIDVTEINNKVITFEGRTSLHLLPDRFTLQLVSSGGDIIPVDMQPFPPFDVIGPEGKAIYKGERFRIDIPIKEGESYRLYLREDTGREFKIIPTFYKYSRFAAGDIAKAAVIRGYMIEFDRVGFKVSKSRKSLEHKYERSYIRYLLNRKKYLVAGYRILYRLDKFFFRKPVWLVADRPHIANDNGEHMFRYLQTTEAAKKNNIYFLIKKDSPDCERLKKTGKVLYYGSHRHKIKFLRAQVILCAAANDLVINAMGDSGRFYRDLIDYDFIYLRHGVSHNDQSQWINKINKHISLLVATCRPEYEGILEGDYLYTEKQVKLTGLPRYDNLYDEREKEIIILPTWRKNLEGEAEYRSSQRGFSGDFADSDYCKFYNALINDERLLKVMEEYGYKGTFYLHPVFEKQYKDFKSSRLISVGKGVADYQELFRKGALMITDFSSVAFDFAYLKKPVIYAQFDEDVFYKYHSWGKGYFTYRKDGFGPITNTLDETVDEIIYYIKNDCKMKEEYVQKVENFFAYTDRNNRKRVYDAVVELEKEREIQ